jgi:hypothetical protein
MTRESRIAIARERKVVAILAELMHQARRSGVELTVDVLEGLDWARAALLAGVRPPSETTISVIRERVRTGQTGRRAAVNAPTCRCGRALVPGTTECAEHSVSDAELMETLRNVRQEGPV